MAHGSGIGSALREAFVWMVGCGVVFGAVFFADDLAPLVDRDGKFRAAVNELVQQGIGAATGRDTSGHSAHGNRNAPQRTSGGRVVLTADAYNQFSAQARINGRSVDVLVDTGASHVSLSYEDARRAGIRVSDRDFTQTAQTANGVARVAPVILDKVQVGGIKVHNVRGLVGEPGAKAVTLLGMSFLGQLRSVNISGRRMELRR